MKLGVSLTMCDFQRRACYKSFETTKENTPLNLSVQ